jgi:hypothetical protein
MRGLFYILLCSLCFLEGKRPRNDKTLLEVIFFEETTGGDRPPELNFPLMRSGLHGGHKAYKIRSGAAYRAQTERE